MQLTYLVLHPDYPQDVLAAPDPDAACTTGLLLCISRLHLL